MRVRGSWMAAACVAAALGIGACGDDDDDGGAATSGAAATAAETTPAASAGGLDQASIDYGLKATGGTAGKADASLDPVRIGFVTQEGGAPSFPEQTAAANAAIKLVNEQLGGIGGHPLEMVPCIVTSEEDGQKCGAQMVNDKLPLVNLAVAVVGNDSLHKTIGTTIPTLITSPTAASDSTAKNAYSMLGGAGPIVGAMAHQATQMGAKRVAILGVGNPAGRFATQELLVPAFDKEGIDHNKPVFFPDDATTPDVASILQAAGATRADAIAFLPSGPANCTSIYDALKQLGVTKPVIGTLLCNADDFIEHTGGAPENWTIVSFGTNPRNLADPEAKVFNNVMTTYGSEQYITAGMAVQGFSDWLLIAKWAGEIGADALTPEAMAEKIKAFTGPAPMNPSDIACGWDPTQPVLCGNAATISTFKDGAWANVGSYKLES